MVRLSPRRQTRRQPCVPTVAESDLVEGTARDGPEVVTLEVRHGDEPCLGDALGEVKETSGLLFLGEVRHGQGGTKSPAPQHSNDGR